MVCLTVGGADINMPSHLLKCCIVGRSRVWCHGVYTYCVYLDLQNPKIFWSMWFVLLYCDDQLKSGRAHTIQTKSGRAWSNTALPVAYG